MNDENKSDRLEFPTLSEWMERVPDAADIINTYSLALVMNTSPMSKDSLFRRLQISFGLATSEIALEYLLGFISGMISRNGSRLYRVAVRKCYSRIVGSLSESELDAEFLRLFRLDTRDGNSTYSE